jgi:Na+/citrate or Na+/malate symporter
MRLLEIYVFFVLPVIAVGMGLGALWLTKPRARITDRNAP